MILATFLPSAAAAATSVQNAAAGWENTMAVQDGEASKLHPKTAYNVTSKTHRR